MYGLENHIVELGWLVILAVGAFAGYKYYLKRKQERKAPPISKPYPPSPVVPDRKDRR